MDAARESGQAKQRVILAAALLTLGLVMLATAVSVYAVFTASTSVTSNDFASDTLDPPTSLSATGGASVDLSWTATADTYASGHRVLRGTASGGPYSQIAEVTPRTTTTYTDSPADGIYYYVLRSFFQNWESVNGNEASATVGTCTAGDTGFLSATAEAADTGGDGDGFELNPTNAFADDGTDPNYKAENINGADDRHRFYNYGFSVPGACIVRGIEVRLDWWVDATSGTNSMDVELSWDGGTTWTAAKTDTLETTTEHTATLGSSTDDWGRTWTVPELSDANFRVRVTSIGANARDFFLDWVPVKVHYEPRAVTILDAWTGDDTYVTQDLAFVPSAGTNRLVLIQVTAEKNTGGPLDVNQVALGDAILTEIGEVVVGDSTAYHNILWFGYLDEAGIAGRTGDTITITYNNAPNNPFGEPKVAVATYQNVDQTTPIADWSQALNAAAATLQPGSVTAGAGDKVVYAAQAGQPQTHTPPAGYTEHIEFVGPSNDHSLATASRDATTASAENPTVTWNASTRLSVIAAVLNVAP